MTTLATPVGHRTMRADDIKPSKSASYSPNLYKWMKAKAHFYADGGVAQGVYRVLENSRLANEFGAGTLFIGCFYNQYEEDKDFSGATLMSALCSGKDAGGYCYVRAKDSLVEVKGFWEQYLEIGRCAIDPQHDMHFLGDDRFVENGDVRTCLWCKSRHKKKLIETVVVKEKWLAI